MASLKTSSRSTPKKVKTGFVKDQVVAFSKSDSFALAVVTEDQPSTTKGLNSTLLKQAGNSTLTFKKAKDKKVEVSKILAQLTVKRQGKYFVLTEKQLENLQKLVDQDDEPPLVVKKRRNPENKTQAPKSKKTRQSIIYKKGVKNSAVGLVEQYELLESPDDSPQFGVSIRVNNLNFFRAVLNDNQKLMRNLLRSDQKISNILQTWGPEDNANCLEMAILSENEYFVKRIVEELKECHIKKTYLPKPSIGYVETGSVSIEAYGVRTRKVQMSRGGREGNNALLQESTPPDTPNILNSLEFLKKLVRQNITPNQIKLLISLYPLCENTFGLCIGEAVRTGNLELSKFLISHFNQKNGYGLNFLHEEVLKSGELSPFKKPSITKKPIENYLVAPLHVACINPDTKHLIKLLENIEDSNYADAEGRKIVHYAAVCCSDEPLRLLAERSVNLSESDKSKITPIMLSVSNNNTKTTEFLLSKSVPINIKSRSGKFPIHFAAENGSLEALSLLLNSGANIDQPGPDRKTALMLASTFGYYDCLNLLLEKGAKVVKKDKCKRSALIFAVKNGHAKEASLLLSKGAPFDDPDSSKNYPVHYAAAYGWVECLNLLIQAGADINVYNDWKIQPLLIAMLKGQTGIVQVLLEQQGVDVNGKDENGRTLVSQAVEMLSEESVEQLKVLLQKKKADCNIVDVNGFSPLHHLCNRGRPVCADSGMSEKEKNAWEEKTWTLQVEVCKLIIDAGCDINLLTREGIPSIMYALKNNNIKLVEVLIDFADLTIISPSIGSVFHCMTTFDTQILKLCQDMLSYKNLSKACLDTVDDEGFTPLLKLVHYFTSNYSLHKQTLYEKIKKQMTLKQESEKLKKSSKTQNTEQPVQAFTYTQGLANLIENNISLDIDYKELENKTSEVMAKNLEEAVKVIKLMCKLGADTNATVGKLKRYRDNPGLIETENGLKPVFSNSSQNKNFILDWDGSKRFKEYGDYGMQNVLHLVAGSEIGEIVRFLLEVKVDCNQRDFYGDTPIMAFVKNSSKFCKNLIQKGVDVNIRNCENDLPLNKAVLNQSLEIVSLLINSNSEINTQVLFGTTPLISSIKSKNLEITEKLLSSSADPNFQDAKRRTALHMAFNTSNSSSNASFDLESSLILHNANINAIDIRGRSPLHYSFVKIRNHRDVSQIDPIESVSSACSLKNIDVNIQDNWNRTPLHYAAMRGSLTSTMFLINKGAKLDIEDYQGNTPLALAIKGGHANYAVMLVQNSANVHKKVNVVLEPEEKRSEEEPLQYLFVGKMPRGAKSARVDYQVKVLKEGVYTMFQAAVIQEWQGLAYLLLFNGYPYMLAMQDSMTQNKFQLVKTLLAKVSDSSVLQKTNENGQNLVHTLAIFGACAEFSITKIICDQLILRGVGLSVLDGFGRSPLHYAAMSGYMGLIRVLLDAGVSLSVKDRDGLSPVAYAIEGEKVCKALEILKLFKDFGAKFDFYLKDEEVKLTPLLHSIKQNAPGEIIKFFLDNGSSIKEKDSIGRNALIYSILNNDLPLFKALLNEKNLDLTVLDNFGRSALHYVIQPLKYGSYENTEMLTMLLKTKKFNPLLPDSENQTPFSLASNQRSTRMLQIFQSFNISGLVPNSRKLSIYEAPSVSHDFHSDAISYMNQQKDLKKVTEIGRQPDPTGEFPEYYKVIDNYDLLMTKVDISKGPYSAYTFYRMQLLHDTNRNVFVLFTRWGRIGETGAFQRTPFADFNEADKEFCKIFKSKSGNEWGSEFEKKKGKYVPMKINLTETKCADFIKEFDKDGFVKSQMGAQLQNAIECCSSRTMYRACFQYYSLDVNVLNFSNLSREGIEEAEGYLLKLSKKLKSLSTESEVSEKIAIIEEIQELSSRFYELIPIIHENNSAIAPIITEQSLKYNLEKIALLKNLELASKLILGALYRQYSVNPYDYIANSLNTNLSILDKSSPEYELIAKYMKMGGGDNEILSVFKVNRKGEAEAIDQFSDEHYRKLLWHGTSTANIIGILMQGLKIAPPEVPNSGYMFGKGVYFADCFSKSLGYCSDFLFSNNSHFILLCEVVLGKMLEKKTAEFIEKLPKGYLSTIGLGKKRPDPNGSIFTPYGAEIPLGKLTEIADPQLYLNYNEYIVYNTSQIRIRYMIHMKS